MSNPVVSTSNGQASALAQQILYNNVIAGANGPVLQIDQKKVPDFHGKKDKDSMTVLAWCQCMDAVVNYSQGAVNGSHCSFRCKV